jgi:hypothetical protein
MLLSWSASAHGRCDAEVACRGVAAWRGRWAQLTRTTEWETWSCPWPRARKPAASSAAATASEHKRTRALDPRSAEGLVPGKRIAPSGWFGNLNRVYFRRQPRRLYPAAASARRPTRPASRPLAGRGVEPAILCTIGKMPSPQGRQRTWPRRQRRKHEGHAPSICRRQGNLRRGCRPGDLRLQQCGRRTWLGRTLPQFGVLTVILAARRR